MLNACRLVLLTIKAASTSDVELASNPKNAKIIIFSNEV